MQVRLTILSSSFNTFVNYQITEKLGKKKLQTPEIIPLYTDFETSTPFVEISIIFISLAPCNFPFNSGFRCIVLFTFLHTGINHSFINYCKNCENGICVKSNVNKTFSGRNDSS